MTVVWDTNYSYDEYCKELNRVNKASMNKKVNSCIDYYIDDYVTLSLFTN